MQVKGLSIIGVDLGSRNFIADSNGNVLKPPDFLLSVKDRLIAGQDKLRRLGKGTRAYKNMQKRLRKIQKKLHSPEAWGFVCDVALAYLRTFDVICVEDYKPTRNSDCRYPFAVWRLFLDVLEGQAEKHESRVVRVNPRLTSQVCSHCGDRSLTLGSSDTYACKCGLYMPRDINAAINIRNLGLIKLIREEERNIEEERFICAG